MMLQTAKVGKHEERRAGYQHYRVITVSLVPQLSFNLFIFLNIPR